MTTDLVTLHHHARPAGTYLTGEGYSFYSTVCPGIPHPSRSVYVRKLTREMHYEQTCLVQSKARALARSGFFYGLTPLEFELSFEDGFHEAREWPELPSTKEELERLCRSLERSIKPFAILLERTAFPLIEDQRIGQAGRPFAPQILQRDGTTRTLAADQRVQTAQ